MKKRRKIGYIKNCIRVIKCRYKIVFPELTLEQSAKEKLSLKQVKAIIKFSEYWLVHSSLAKFLVLVRITKKTFKQILKLTKKCLKSIKHPLACIILEYTPGLQDELIVKDSYRTLQNKFKKLQLDLFGNDSCNTLSDFRSCLRNEQL